MNSTNLLFPINEYDESVFHYQMTNDSRFLVKVYHNFIQKWVSLFFKKDIDFTNYNIRRFLSCYAKDREMIQSLRRGKYHSAKTKTFAHEVLRLISRVFESYDKKEIEAEITILFLEKAKAYKDIGSSFNNYLYHSFRYDLKRWIDSHLYQVLDSMPSAYWEQFNLTHIIEKEEGEDIQPSFSLSMNDDLLEDLNNPLWINGNQASVLFKHLSIIDRHILIQYYMEQKTDKEIARFTGLNPKSIHRKRMRMKKQLESLYEKGEIKWLRLS